MPKKNQERWNAKYAKVWALHKDAIKLLTWELLLIVRRLSYNPVSHKQQETGKIETLSRSYIFLAHSTWARWWRSWSLQVDHLSWLHFAWWRLTYRSPIHQDGSASLRNIFTWPLSPNGLQASSIWYLLDAHLELAHLNLDDDHHLTSSFMSYKKSSFWCKPMERYLTPTKECHTHIMG